MRLAISKTYTLLLALAVVAGPFIWLVLTEDGQRRTDLLLLHLLGRPTFNVAFDQLRPAVREEHLREQFPRVDLRCEAVASPFGERACGAAIAGINGIPARQTLLFFDADGGLAALRLDYRRRYHDLLARGLRERYGEPRRDLTDDGAVLVWRFDGGALLLSEQAPPKDDAALMWLAPGPATASAP